MTNRDAINLLEEVKMLDDTMYAYNPCYEEALDMALTALEAEDPWYATHEYEKWNIDPDAVIPTIEPKKGEWIQRPYDGIYCSECGKGWSYMLGAPSDIESYHYCPHCGKRMKCGSNKGEKNE